MWDFFKKPKPAEESQAMLLTKKYDVPVAEQLVNTDKPAILIVDDSESVCALLADDLDTMTKAKEYFTESSLSEMRKVVHVKGKKLPMRYDELLLAIHTEEQYSMLLKFDITDFDVHIVHGHTAAMQSINAILDGYKPAVGVLDIIIDNLGNFDGVYRPNGIDIAYVANKSNPMFNFVLFTGCFLYPHSEEAIHYKELFSDDISSKVIKKIGVPTGVRQIALLSLIDRSIDVKREAN